MTYRFYGRATHAEEKFLWNRDKDEKTFGMHKIDGKEVTPKKKHKELKALFDKYGPSAFDKEQTNLFDKLNAAYGGCNFDSKADSASAQIKSQRAARTL